MNQVKRPLERTYAFKLSRQQKETIELALLMGPLEGPAHPLLLADVFKDEPYVILNTEQVAVVIRHIQEAIEHYENVGDDWFRVQDCKSTRDHMIDTARNQFTAVKEND